MIIIFFDAFWYIFDGFVYCCLRRIVRAIYSNLFTVDEGLSFNDYKEKKSSALPHVGYKNSLSLCTNVAVFNAAIIQLSTYFIQPLPSNFINQVGDL